MFMVHSRVKVVVSDTRDVMPSQSAVEFRRKWFKLSPVTKTATITSIRQDAVLQVSRARRRVAGCLLEPYNHDVLLLWHSATAILRLQTDMGV